MRVTTTVIVVALLLAAVDGLVCTVDNTGTIGSPDFTDLPTAVASCRGVYPDLDVVLACIGNYSLNGLVVPNHINLLAFQSYSGIASDLVFTDVGISQDTIDFAARPDITFGNATFELNNSTNPLFFDTLVNQNFTMSDCIVNNTAASSFITQEVCRNDMITFGFQRNLISNVAHQLLNLTGLSGYIITNNNCKFCGTNLTVGGSLVYIKQSDVASLPRIFNFNDFYRAFNCRQQPRCLYSWPTSNSGFYARCNKGEVECYDEVRTMARGNCPIIPITITDPETNATEVVMEPDPSCRVFGPCECTTIRYVNASRANAVSVVSNGNLVYGGNSVHIVLPCRPRVTEPFGKKLYLFKDHFFSGTRYVGVGDDVPSLGCCDFNDKASSAQVGLGYGVTLYKHDDYQGDSIHIVGFNSDFPAVDFNDEASSYKFDNVSWTSYDVPLFNSSQNLPLPDELDQDIGYYTHLWRQPANMVYVSAKNPLRINNYPASYQLSVKPKITFANGTSFFMFFDAGRILPTSCPIAGCQIKPGGDNLACNYTIYPGDSANPTNDTEGTLDNTLNSGSADPEVEGDYVWPYPVTPFDMDDYLAAQCFDGDVYCCKTPDDAQPNYPAYAVHCSQSPNASIPVLNPDGTLAAGLDQIPDQVYHCTYLVNCTYNSGVQTLDSCKQFSCGLMPCRLGVTYQPSDDCYDILHIGQSNECNTGNPSASGDRVCTFLVNQCDQYYYNGYLKAGYVFASQTASNPGSQVIPSICEFDPNVCAATIASQNGNTPLDSLCYCSQCGISPEANGGCSLSTTVNAPLPTQDAHCYSAVLTATGSITTLSDCINNVSPDQGCQAAQAACDWTSLPPYEDMVNGEQCFTVVQAFFASGVTVASCMNSLFITSDTGCVLARQACVVDRLTRPPNLPCLYASMNGGTPTPVPTNTAFPAPATYPPSVTSPPSTLDPCFDLSVTSPNASCTTARSTCYVYFPQPYAYPDPSCFYSQYQLSPSAVPMHQCMDLSFGPTDVACDSARTACMDRKCFDLLGLGANNAWIDCSNPYSTDDEVDSFCLWLRHSCITYYDPGTAELLSGYCFATDPTCVGIIIPHECELDASSCASSGDTRCTCSSDSGAFPTAPNTPVTQITDIIYGRPNDGSPYIAPLDPDGNQWPIFEPSSNPVRLPRPLRFPDPAMACPTMMWAACECPPQNYQHGYSIFQSCDRTNDTYCNPDTYSYDVMASDFNNASISSTSYYTWPKNDYSTTSLNNQIGITGLYCSATTKKMKCDCSFSRLVFLSGNPPTENTSAVHIDNLSVNNSDFQMVDNAACDYWWGCRQDQTDPNLQRQKMFAAPGFFDSFSGMRDPWKNPNDYVLGQFDWVQEPYSYDPRWCIGGCPQSTWGGLPEDFAQDEADYIVDCGVSPSSPSYGVTIFKSLYHLSVSQAQGDGKRVYIRDCGKAYAEPVPFSCPAQDAGCDQDQQPDDLVVQFTSKHSNWHFFSYDSPKIIAANIQIKTPDVQGMIFQGIHFQHPGDTRDRLIRLVKGKGRQILTHLYFLNCEFEGAGVTGAGILSIIGEVRTFIMAYSDIKNWNTEALLVNRARYFVFIGNVVSHCIGNVVHGRVIDIYAVRDNTFLDARGGGKIKGAAVITLTSTYDLFDVRVLFAGLLGTFLPDLARTCKPEHVINVPPYFPGAVPINKTDPFTDWQLQCNVWNNAAITDLLSDDFPDTFIEIWQGQYNDSLTIGNAVLKAQFGIAYYGVLGLDPNPDQLARLAMQNPRVRPSKYRSPDAPAGADYKGITPFSWVEVVFGMEPRSRDSWETNWPASGDVAQMFREGNISCVVNSAYSPRTMESAYVFNVLWHQYRWAYGYSEFRNGSDAVLFCTDFRDYGFPPVLAPEIYYLSWSGSEYIRDNVSLFQNVRIHGDPSTAFKPGIAVTMFGTNVTVIMDQGVPLPTPCSLANGVKPCARSQGNTIATLLARMDDMCWQPLGSQLGINLWSTADPAPVSFESYRCDFDGRKLIPLNNVYALLIYCGTIIPGNDQTAPEETDELPLPTSCTIYFDGNNVDNFTTYDARVVSTSVRGFKRHVLLSNYPYASGPVFIALNDYNTASSIEFINNSIANIDRTSITIRNFINATIEDNAFYNSSMRSIGNTASIFLEGNPAYSTVPDVSNDEPPGRGSWKFNRNRASQEKTALTPYGANTAFPVLLPGLYVRALAPNTTFCMFNNTIWSYPVSARFTDFNFSILATCPAPGQVIGFPDAQRYLRFIAENNFCKIPHLNGTIYDLEISFKGTALEAYRDAIFCNLCCEPGPPTACWVDLTTTLFNTGHPWWDWAVFTSYNRAIERCNVSSATIFIIGQSDPFLAGDGLPTPFHVYTEVFNTVVPPPYTNQSNTLTIIGDVGMIILANGHYLSNPNNRTVFIQGIEFVDSGVVSGPAIWDFTNAAHITNLITIRSNKMVGNGSTTNRAIDGSFDGRFEYSGNQHLNYSTTISNARFTAETCATQVNILRNSWQDMYGNVLEVHVNNGEVKKNKFVRCGGSPVPADTDRWVTWVNPTCICVPGRIEVDENSFTKPPVVDADPSRTLWTSLYIDPVPWNLFSNYLVHGACDVKTFTFYDTKTAGLQIGIRLSNINVECGKGDPQSLLRFEIYDRFRNAHVQGTVFDLYIGAFDNFEEQTRIANRDAHELPPHPEDITRCYHCQDGCPAFHWAIGSIVLLAIAIGALLLLCLICGLCGDKIGCTRCCMPIELRPDPTTGVMTPPWWYYRFLFPGLDHPNVRMGKPYMEHPDTVGMAQADANLVGRAAYGTGDTQANLVKRGVFRVG